MASVNKVILLGNVGHDPEVRYTQGGDPIANFSLATTEKWTDKSGEKQERTEWHRVEVFGKLAGIVKDYVTKGKGLYLEGQLRTDEWTDKEGNKRKTTKIRVDSFSGKVVLLGGGERKDDTQEHAQRRPARVAEATESASTGGDGWGDNDSIPF